MSYDFWISVDTGGPESHRIDPCFDDQHPALGVDGHAGNVLVTATGFSRCGNYTSNVSPMWARCLTAARDEVPAARAWCGASNKAFNASGRTASRLQPDGTWKSGPLPVDEDTLTLRDLPAAGVTCAELAPVLRAAVAWGIDHLEELREMNPENGWGDAEGAITYLWDIQRMCEAHPLGTLEIWA